MSASGGLGGTRADKELLLHEAMARLLSKAGNHWDTYDNHKVSEALERYLNGSADKDEADMD